MSVLFGLRLVLALLLAVLLPLGQAHCALTMPHQPASVAVEGEHDNDEDGCCPKPVSHPTSPTDPCCCDSFQLPSATAPPSLAVDSPTSVPTSLAVVPQIVSPICAQPASVRLEPDARSGSPPDPSADPQSPRSPPQSA